MALNPLIDPDNQPYSVTGSLPPVQGQDQDDLTSGLNLNASDPLMGAGQNSPMDQPDPLEEPEITTIHPEPFGELGVPKTEPKPTAKSKCPPIFRNPSARKEFEMKVGQAIRAGLEQKGDLNERIRRNEAFYENKTLPPTRLPWPGAQFFHIPITSPRLEQRRANIVKTIVGQEPILRYKDLGRQDRIEELEQTIQWHLDACNFEAAFDRIMEIMMVTNCPVWRVTYQEFPEGADFATIDGPYNGIKFDAIHPEYMVIWPAVEAGIDGARCHGHCMELMVSDVKVKQKRKEWFNVPITGGDQHIRKEREGDLQSLEAGSAELDDMNVVLWDVIWKEDLNQDGIEERYRVIIHEQSNTILLIEPFSMPMSWYVMMSLKRETGNCWTEGSAAQDLQGLQVLINTLFNEYLWGTQMASRPPILAEGMDLSGDSLKGYRPGEWRNVRAINKAMPVPVQFNGQSYPVLLNMAKEASDSVSKTPDTMTGSPSNQVDATATEQNIKFAGFQLSGSADVTAITPALIRVGKLVKVLLADNFDSWYPLYQHYVSIKSADDLKQGTVVEVSGKTPEDAPQMQIQESEMLLQLAGQFPQAGIPVADLLRAIVDQTNLVNKEDILRAIDQNQQQLGVMQNQQQMMQALAPLVQAHAQGTAMGQQQLQPPQGQKNGQRRRTPTGPGNPQQLVGAILAMLGNANGPGGPGAGQSVLPQGTPPTQP